MTFSGRNFVSQKPALVIFRDSRTKSTSKLGKSPVFILYSNKRYFYFQSRIRLVCLANKKPS